MASSSCLIYRLQQAQLLRRRMAVMNTRTAPPTSVPALPSNMPGPGGNGGGPGPGMPQMHPNNAGNPMPGGSGGMSPASAVSSPISSMGNMGSPHQPGIPQKPGTQTPPANVLQVVKQVSLIYFQLLFVVLFRARVLNISNTLKLTLKHKIHQFILFFYTKIGSRRGS